MPKNQNFFYVFSQKFEIEKVRGQKKLKFKTFVLSPAAVDAPVIEKSLSRDKQLFFRAKKIFEIKFRTKLRETLVWKILQKDQII